MHRIASRRAVLGGGASLLIAGAIRPSPAYGGVRRPLDWSDICTRSEIERIAMAPGGGTVAVQVTRPLGGPGRHGGVSERHIQPRGDIWILDDNLRNPRLLDLQGLWAWAPAFSPRGRYLASFVSRSGGLVGIVVWSMKDLSAKMHPDINANIGTHFRCGDVSEGEPSIYGDIPRQFAWLDEENILLVQSGDEELAFERELEGALETYPRLWERSAGGVAAVRVWNSQSPVCGTGRTIARLEWRTGALTPLYKGDVRGVAVSPSRDRLAVVVATGRLSLPANQPVPPALGYMTPLDDPAVTLGLVRISVADGIARAVEGISAVGALPGRRLPLWSTDGKSFALAARNSYSSRSGEDGDVCWQVDAADLRVTRWQAKSALDADVMAALMAATPHLEAASAIENRGAFGTTTPYALSVSSSAGMVWKVGDAGVAVWDRHVLSVILGRRVQRLPKGYISVYPATSGDHIGGLLCIVDRNDADFVTFTGETWRADRIAWHPEWTVLGVDAHRSRAIVKEDSDDGTSMFAVGAQGKTARSSLRFNTHFRDVERPSSRRVFGEVQGREQFGILQLPVGRKRDCRHPVIVWAYPNQPAAPDAWLTRLNSVAAVWRPVQYLLTRGFAVFHAPLTMPLKGIRQPLELVTNAVLPWLDVLAEQPELLAGEYGFFGHSNAGYVAMALEVITSRFKAIAASGTFPDLGLSSFAARSYASAVDCAPGVIQAERFYYEDDTQPYGLGTPFWQDPGRFLSNSPLYRMHAANTPLLLMVGEFDAEVHEMEEVYSILHARGVPVELAKYWGEGHILASPGNIRDSWNRTEGFFRKYLQVRR